MNAFWLLVGRDLRLRLRQGGDSAMVLVFFVLGVALFPLGVGPEANILARIGPASSGSPRCWPRCWRSTSCSAPITRTAIWNC